MIDLDPESLRALQLTELELLDEVDRICRLHGIHYNIIAGTLLGARRNGGFIPWDDDADVALLRDEYERFRDACVEDLDHSRFYFQDHRNTPGYRWGYGKLRRKGTVFLREHQEHMPYEQGVFIDVFPLDAIPDSYLGRTLENFRCYLVRKALWARVGKVADASPVRRFLFSLVDRIPEQRVLSIYDHLVKSAAMRRRRSGGQGGWVRILTFPTPNRQWGYRRHWYEDSVETSFEGHSFSGIADYEDYLSFKFGEWRKLPPESQRKTHPVSAFQLVAPTEDPACGSQAKAGRDPAGSTATSSEKARS